MYHEARVVHQHEVVPLALQCRQRLKPVADDIDLIAHPAEYNHSEPDIDGVVFGNQDV
jgi:hypothetical protein